MEAGRIAEATILTPSEVRWIEQALTSRDKMARHVLAQAKGRIPVCGEADEEGGAECGRPATHFTVDSGSGTMTCYCLKHWREADPANVTGLYDADVDDAGSAAAETAAPADTAVSV